MDREEGRGGGAGGFDNFFSSGFPLFFFSGFLFYLNCPYEKQGRGGENLEICTAFSLFLARSEIPKEIKEKDPEKGKKTSDGINYSSLSFFFLGWGGGQNIYC